MALTKIDDRGLTTPIDLLDNEKIRFCTGNDGEIYFDGTDSIFTSAGKFRFKHGTDTAIKTLVDGGVYLSHDNSIKFYTTASGVFVGGHIDLDDNSELQIGTGDDLKIYHDGSHSRLVNSTGTLLLQSNDVFLKSQDSSETHIICSANGAVELYNDNSKKFETTATGAKTTGRLEIYNQDDSNYNVLDCYNDNGSVSGGFSQNSDGDGTIFAKYKDANNNMQFGVLIKSDGDSYLNGGNLGIGTTSPTPTDPAYNKALLHIHQTQSGTYGSEIHLTNAATGSAAGNGMFISMWNDDDVYFTNQESDGKIKFNTGGNTNVLVLNDDGKVGIGTNSPDRNLNLYNAATDGSCYLKIENNRSRNAAIQFTTTQGTWYSGVGIGTDVDRFMIYDGVERLGIGSLGETKVYANKANDYALWVQNDGANTSRYGILIQCGADDAAGTNYALGVADGNSTTQGYLTFTGGTLSLVAFTASHPCIIPDADNPSDNSMAYPYGTLLETISIQYSKNKKDGSDTERGIRYKVQKTQSANSRKVLGAYAGSMNGGPEGQTNEHDAYVLGDGHILVNNAGGNIEVGDGICSSATAGIGQKATANPSMIIGIAQEAITFTGSETKLVAVQYGLQQFIPWT